MVRLGKHFGWLVVLAVAVIAMPGISRAQAPQTVAPQSPPASTAAKPAQAVTHHGKKKAAPVAEVAPTPPPPPPTLEQSPPTAPRISYQGGQLTIEAHNSTLAQVLRAVQVQTGASMEIPGGANAERVVGQIGPGQPREVLNTLLNGTKFDYVILGVTGNPGAVQKVILTPRQSSASNVNSAQNGATQAQPIMQEEDPQPDEAMPADTAEVENQNQNQNPDQPPPTPGGFRRPIPQPQGDAAQAFSSSGDQQNGVKTPEQLMQELQQMQQQQQQYQQQLNPANQNPPQ